MEDEQTPYERFKQRYADSQIPWDAADPPPEVMAAAERLPAGRALDLGCGFGRAAIYLARHGWQVDGIDFIARAIEVARERAELAGVSSLARFHVGSAAELGHLDPPYVLAIDVGCMHSFDQPTLTAYRDELLRLLVPGGLYLLFARLRDESPAGDGPRGIPEDTVRSLFAGGFILEQFNAGETQTEDKPAWHSGWFWFRRAEAVQANSSKSVS